MRLPAILVVLVLLLVSGCSSVGPNAAEQQQDAILAGLSSIHPVKRCGHGDNGKGVDNNAPWFYGYAEIDAVPDLPARVTAAAKAAGFTLGNLSGEPFDGSTLDPLATQLRGTHNGTNLDVIIAPRPYVASCDWNTTDEPVLTPQHGKVILFLGVEMPEQ